MYGLGSARRKIFSSSLVCLFQEANSFLERERERNINFNRFFLERERERERNINSNQVQGGFF